MWFFFKVWKFFISLFYANFPWYCVICQSSASLCDSPLKIRCFVSNIAALRYDLLGVFVTSCLFSNTFHYAAKSCFTHTLMLFMVQLNRITNCSSCEFNFRSVATSFHLFKAGLLCPQKSDSDYKINVISSELSIYCTHTEIIFQLLDSINRGLFNSLAPKCCSRMLCLPICGVDYYIN